MIFDFNNTEETIMENFKGGEKSLAAKMNFDGLNRILHGRLIPGASIGMHTHDTSSEIIYILEGKGKVIFNGETSVIEKGMCHYCPLGNTHSLINDSSSDLIFFAVVPEQKAAE